MSIKHILAAVAVVGVVSVAASPAAAAGKKMTQSEVVNYFSFKLQNTTMDESSPPVALPAPGSSFQANSFFDVFTEISIDGGQTWLPRQTGATLGLQIEYLGLNAPPGTQSAALGILSSVQPAILGPDVLPGFPLMIRESPTLA